VGCCLVHCDYLVSGPPWRQNQLVFIKILILKYVHQYRKITMQENGRPGPWFYSHVVSMNLALVLAITGIMLKMV